MKKILIVGTGGREHAIALSIAQEGHKNQSSYKENREYEIIFCQESGIPALLPQVRLVLGPVLEVARQEAVDLVIIGPEAPLVAGLVDELSAAGFSVFGPSAAAARLEGSKSFAKNFMQQYGVRTPDYKVFTQAREALRYLEELADSSFPLVVKADGLAAGKGVLICKQREAACKAIHSLMEEKVFQAAGTTVVIEQYLQGYEASILAFCDGSSIRPMLAAKDHKKIFEGDCGENTGGMGCVAPHPQFIEGSAVWQDFQQNILEPTLWGIQEQGWDFCGILFFGVMVQREAGSGCEKSYLLEYNMRFGDPEAQTVLPLLQTPLLDIIQSCLMGNLAEQEIRWLPGASCTIVAAAEGYPQSPVIGDLIENLQVVSPNGLEAAPVPEGLYLAAAKLKDQQLYTAGGRVLACNSTALDLEKARAQAYQKLLRYPFRAMQYRRDIGGPPIVECEKKQVSMKSSYHYLLVGAGLFSCTFAYLARQKGLRVLLVDRREHLGGNVYTEVQDGITVHKYGAHIFHTSSKPIWQFVQQFAEFNHYINSPLANYKGQLYSLPFNMNTFYQLWGCRTPKEARQKLDEQRSCEQLHRTPKNLEEQALQLVGRDIYETIIKGYTEKQWGRPCCELPAFIIRRLPFRFTFDNNYFKDPYQGIPTSKSGGYSAICEQLIAGAELELGEDFLLQCERLQKLAQRSIYTGMIDEYFAYVYGQLGYRSLHFQSKTLQTDNYQGNAVVNYTDSETPYTRIIEHKHFDLGSKAIELGQTVVTWEYPKDFRSGDEPFYPINDQANHDLLRKYQQRAVEELAQEQVYFAGRLGSYKYFDMDQVIAEAATLFRKLEGGSSLLQS